MSVEMRNEKGATGGLVPYLSEQYRAWNPSDRDGRGAGHRHHYRNFAKSPMAQIVPNTNQNSRPVAAGLKAETAGMVRRARAESFMVAIP